MVLVSLSVALVMSQHALAHVAALQAPENTFPAEPHHQDAMSTDMLSGTILRYVGDGPWHTDDPAALNVPRWQLTHVV